MDPLIGMQKRKYKEFENKNLPDLILKVQTPTAQVKIKNKRIIEEI